MGHNSAVSGHPISTSFPQVDNWSMDLRVLGRHMYLLKSKDEAIEKFFLYKNEVENQLNKKIKVLRSDRGGEYESLFVDFCAQHGIIHENNTLFSSIEQSY